MSYLPVVSDVVVVGSYRLRLLFDDGTVGDVDFSAREWSGVFKPMRDQSFFEQVAVDPVAGTVVWPDGLDMAPEPLYEEALRHQVVGSAQRDSLPLAG